MEQLPEQAALLALLRDATGGWSALTDELEEGGSATEVLRRHAVEGQGDLLGGDPEAEVADRVSRAATAIAEWRADGMSLVTVLDHEYPEQLRTVHQRPPFLMYRGRLDAGDARGVAVVGTREASAEGLRRAADIAAGLAERGVPVISGLAKGIDTAAHRGALDAGGRTVAVIGTGLRRAYPAENAELQERLGRDHLVISQFWPDSPPTKHSFPMRNAVMSGYAAATVVVEAAYRSGARMQARLALEHRRPVFLLDALLEHEWARDFARRPGTTVVSGPDEVLRALDDVLAPVSELVLA